MIIKLIGLLTLSALHVVAAVTWSATPFNPASVPLAVRSPYLSAWLDQGAGTALNANWPHFWTGSILGWAGYVKVDGTTYNFLGAPSVPATTVQKAVQKSLTFTSTQSTFVMTAGPVDLTVNFLSPVEPTDLVKQSLPFSYFVLSAAPNDGKSHSVQVYSDISAEWVSGDDSLTVNWTTTTGSVVTHQVQLEQQTLFGEVSDRIQQGSAFYSTPSVTGLTYQTGQDEVVRAQFINSGKLLNTQDTQFRAVSDDWPVFALSHDLGTISTATPPVVISIGHVRDPAVQYIIANGALQNRSLYFWSQFSSVQDAISSFLGDYSNALSRAQTFDSKVQTDASAISADYASIVALSVRQAFGATEITVSKTTSGSFDTSDIMMFMKGKYLLLPLFEYQATGQYPNKWSFNLLDQWTQFLISDSLIPANQISTDDFAGSLANQTNLAIKGIVGIKAMSVIASLAGQAAKSSNYSSISASYVTQWQKFATSSTGKHLTLSVNIPRKLLDTLILINFTMNGNSTEMIPGMSLVQSGHCDNAYFPSWGLSYNMFADKLLGTNVFPQSVYDMHWEIWTSAIVSSNTVRDLFITAVRNYAADGKSSQPLGDWYETADGSVEGFRARPVVGGHLALLALQTQPSATTEPNVSAANVTAPTIAGPSSNSAPGMRRWGL
ncbi:hypothetical protein PHLCEN_2v1612 [Hermanssonia centrifuga]|uniref:DUF1793-domain-containing protein n=1 Tax=Hermanssonia centrifuga TaxID=98765 RepID=A0A2R6RZM3_9APHY|nr:hypothetical protein PHLCEN_2v1612 [Hermanssonia centrifuga]